jgi:hypothetical protein
MQRLRGTVEQVDPPPAAIAAPVVDQATPDPRAEAGSVAEQVRNIFAQFLEELIQKAGGDAGPVPVDVAPEVDSAPPGIKSVLSSVLDEMIRTGRITTTVTGDG